MLAALGTRRTIWLVGTVALTALSLWMIFLYAPADANLGEVQRALYIHVPVAFASMIAVVVVAVASVMFLITGRNRWDWVALASAETGVLAGTLVIITGAVWAKPVWTVWWTWDAKLTTTAVLWFIYVAYLMLRAYAPAGTQGLRIAAVVAILGAVDAPLIYWSAELWRTAHPEWVFGPVAESGGLSSEMQTTLWVSLIAFTSVFVYIFYERYRVRRTEETVVELTREVRGLAPAARGA